MAETDPRFAALTSKLAGALRRDSRALAAARLDRGEAVRAGLSRGLGPVSGHLLDTLTDDCVMEVRSAGMRFDGIEGAREFYETFILSFEGMHWTPQALVIGPQGGLDVAGMTEKLKAFGGLVAVGERLRTQ